jgi:hypothetical protein
VGIKGLVRSLPQLRIQVVGVLQAPTLKRGLRGLLEPKMWVSAPGVQRARSHPIASGAWSELGYEDVSIPKFWNLLVYNEPYNTVKQQT